MLSNAGKSLKESEQVSYSHAIDFMISITQHGTVNVVYWTNYSYGL